MKSINRRKFLKTSLFAATTVSFSAKSWSQVKGANDTIRTATIGFHGRGNDHIKGFKELAPEGVKYTALCDVDSKVLNKGVETFKKDGIDVTGFKDIRKLLEMKDLDVVSIATPNHWHALAAIWAIQAGKDVYVEKPVCHNVWEGRKIIEAARKYKKIVQAGTQSRSSHGIREAVQWVKEGNLGKILISRGLCYKPRPSIGKHDGPQQVPESIDYDLWSGPAPLVPPRRNSDKYGTVHYDWHWFWNYGNGDLGNQGIHQMDIARWFLDEPELSPRILSIGGRLGYEDDGETPNTQVIFHDYAKAPLIFEVRGLPSKTGSRDMDKFMGGSISVIVHCEGGYVLVPDYTGATAYDKDGKEIKKWKGSTSHFENFINAVRSRKVSDLHADINEGFLSSALCHTGNISYRLGKQASPDDIRAKIKADKDALPTFNRMAEHLEANGVDLSKTKATIGEVLKMDPKTEKFIGNKEADKLLTRDYRKPYVVPEKV